MNAPWTPVTEALPPNSKAVLITDGKEICEAHYFKAGISPITGEPYAAEWCNFNRLFYYGIVWKPTHWMSLEAFEKYMLEGVPTPKRKRARIRD